MSSPVVNESSKALVCESLPYQALIQLPPAPSPTVQQRSTPALMYRHPTLSPLQVECLRVMCDFSTKMGIRRVGDSNTLRGRSTFLGQNGRLPPPATANAAPSAPRLSQPAAGASASVIAAAAAAVIEPDPMIDDPIE